MIIKSQYYLQPTVQEAHSVVIEDSAGNIIYIAVQVNNAIVTAQAGDPNFNDLVKAFGIDKTTIVTDFKPKSLQEMQRLL